MDDTNDHLHRQTGERDTTTGTVSTDLHKRVNEGFELVVGRMCGKDCCPHLRAKTKVSTEKRHSPYIIMQQTFKQFTNCQL